MSIPPTLPHHTTHPQLVQQALAQRPPVGPLTDEGPQQVLKRRRHGPGAEQVAGHDLRGDTRGGGHAAEGAGVESRKEPWAPRGAAVHESCANCR